MKGTISFIIVGITFVLAKSAYKEGNTWKAFSIVIIGILAFIVSAALFR